MSGTWNTTTQSITWFMQQRQLKTLNLDPDYQRNVVWPLAYKIFLMDTIINNLSIPKIYVEAITNEKGETNYNVADGKQRLTAIFNFLDNGFSLDKKYAPKIKEDFDGANFDDLPVGVKKGIFEYRITVDELQGYTTQEMKEMFVRLNKNNERLSKQELRNAAYAGDFIGLAEDLSENAFWHDHKILSQKEVRRMKDVEFVSELLMMLDRGIADKTRELDEYYSSHEIMEDKEERKKRFLKVFHLIQDLLPEIESTRFKFKGDYYSLFYVVGDFIAKGYKFEGEKIDAIRKILVAVSNGATLKSENEELREYQNLSTQSSDSLRARKFRATYLATLIEPLLVKTDEKRLFSESEKRFIWHRIDAKVCAICGKEILRYADYEPNHKKPWSKGGPTIIANGEITHISCNRAKQDKE